jgi:hypothetical protein
MPVASKKVRPITIAHCVCCNHDLSIDEFYKSDNPHHGSGVCPCCKSCSKQMFEDNWKKFKEVKAALWVTCSEMGIPFIEKVYANLIEKVNKSKQDRTFSPNNYNYWGNFISSYMALKRKTDKWDSFGYTDSEKSETIPDVSDEKRLKEKKMQFILDWGDQEDEDYAYLEYRWDFYTEDITLTPAQESLYRKLCLSELDYRKAKDANQAGKEEQDSILKLMKTLKIDNFVQKKEKSEIENMIEYQAWEFENTTPAECEDLEKYKDFCNIEQEWYKSVIRSIRNLVAGMKEYPLIPRKRDE